MCRLIRPVLNTVEDEAHTKCGSFVMSLSNYYHQLNLVYQPFNKHSILYNTFLVIVAGFEPATHRLWWPR